MTLSKSNKRKNNCIWNKHLSLLHSYLFTHKHNKWISSVCLESTDKMNIRRIYLIYPNLKYNYELITLSVIIKIFSKVLELNWVLWFVITNLAWEKRRSLGVEVAGIPKYFLAKIGKCSLLMYHHLKGSFSILLSVKLFYTFYAVIVYFVEYRRKFRISDPLHMR
jgi:hypothetical protein